ncbi:hypothetical protein F0Z19_3976 [Vibrio cyclitrophicus]|nr:hypothetical protein M565_ctg1P1668 [Vibrio cyclitrophicus FF75]KAA8597551.1 hypothetical protein F0Z19_3976 [Vibrio cyclitrophicus]
MFELIIQLNTRLISDIFVLHTPTKTQQSLFSETRKVSPISLRTEILDATF